MPVRNSGKIGQFMQWVRDFRVRESRLPTYDEIRSFGDVDYVTRAEGLRRVRVEFGDPKPPRQRARKASVLRDRAWAFIDTYYAENKILPSAPATVEATNVSPGTARSTIREFQRKIGVPSRTQVRRDARVATSTRTQNDRQAEIMKVYNDLAATYPNVTTNAIMVATAAITGITRQRVHQVLVFE